jgi:hypothetical protein
VNVLLGRGSDDIVEWSCAIGQLKQRVVSYVRLFFYDANVVLQDVVIFKSIHSFALFCFMCICWSFYSLIRKNAR